MSQLQMWGGLECTLNRIGDRYMDQCEKNGHRERVEDLRRFADLGLKKIRYPCLWERVAPDRPDHKDWRWTDERLGEIRRLSMTPIVGFLHHGSGPHYTSLIDPELPKKMADYARAFAERFPWVEDFTPFNEINTTARFSCLYGHWYPHQRSDSSYVKALVLQCKATVLAMREIRRIVPSARLIQTDDLGRTQGSPKLLDQVRFENERRWIAWDLLCGRVNPGHTLYWFFTKHGVTAEELQWQMDNPCPPDIIGVNHYFLSNRFLDEELDHYPSWAHGGNGFLRYADVGAVDTGRAEIPSPVSILLETWERYRIPIAVTEVHAVGGREAQLRWLYQMWKSAKAAKATGADVRAVTAWSLLGTYDWNTLCTQPNGFYEPGVFDLRTSDGHPRPTALATLVKELATSGESDSPLLEETGCWNTSRRILFAAQPNSYTPLWSAAPRPVLLTGATGTLGQAFARICGARNIPYRLLGRSELDIADPERVHEVFAELNPWAVINCAGYVRVDEAEVDREKCFRENVLGPMTLAKACASLGVRFVTFSTDLVFNGEAPSAYREKDAVAPLNVYGESKASCEREVLMNNPEALVVRTSSFFGPWDQFNFITQTLQRLKAGVEVHAISDVRVSPTYVPDLVHATLDLLIDGERGLIHLTNQGAVSWADFARMAANSGAKLAPIDPRLIVDRNLLELKLPARRPRNAVLTSSRWKLLPPLEDALSRYISQVSLGL